MNETMCNIVYWAHDRNLIQGTTTEKQFIKLAEEMGELAETIAKKKPEEFKMELGDMLVVLTIIAAQNGTSLDKCYGLAWDKIKDRKGKNIDGFYVKEEDLL